MAPWTIKWKVDRMVDRMDRGATGGALAKSNSDKGKESLGLVGKRRLAMKNRIRQSRTGGEGAP